MENNNNVQGPSNFTEEEYNGTSNNQGMGYTGPLNNPGMGYTGPLNNPGMGYTGPLNNPGVGYTDPSNNSGMGYTGPLNNPGMGYTGPLNNPGMEYTGPSNGSNKKNGNKLPNSNLSKWALLLCLFIYTGIIGVPLAIYDILRKDGRKKIISFAAIGVSAMWILLFLGNSTMKIINRKIQDKHLAERTIEETTGSNSAETEATEAATEEIKTEEITSETTADTVSADGAEITDEYVLSYERTSIKLSGFDPETNISYSFSGYDYDLPKYFIEVSSNDENSKAYRAQENNNNFLQVAVFNLGNETIEDVKSAINEMLSEMGSINSDYTDVTISGLNGFVVEGRFKSTSENDIYFGDYYSLALRDTEKGKIIVLVFLEKYDTKYDYIDDVKKVCETFRVSDGSVTRTGISEEFKQSMDAYEEFMDEYIEFMKLYSSNPSDTEVLSQYFDFMTKYSDFALKISNMNEDEMTDEEAAYYVEVTARVTKKLLEAGLSY